MGLPSKRRTSRSKRERGRHLGEKAVHLRVDADGTVHRPHHASPTTGKYRGRQAMSVEKRAARANKKRSS